MGNIAHGSAGRVELLQIDQVFNRHFKSLYSRKCLGPFTPANISNSVNGSETLRTQRALPPCSPNFLLGYNLVSPESPRSGPIHKVG